MKQDKALDILKAGQNVFLTGSAGTGKTYVLNQYIDYLKARKVSIAVTASTGIAATHIKGMTIHGWSGLGIKDSITRRNLNLMATKKYLKKPLEKVKVLIIDEISMLHKKQFEAVNTILQYFKNSARPFGGVQIIVCGDFFQLPPVTKVQEASRDKFCFMAPAWVDAAFKVCYLTEQYRQEKDDLTEILDEMRSDSISEESLQALQSRNISTEAVSTKLYTHNVDVDRENERMLDLLDAPKKTFKAKVTGNQKLKEALASSVLAPVDLKLKKGAKVMFVKNNFEAGYVNGSLGEVLGFNPDGFPIVELKSGKILTVGLADWEIRDDEGKKLAGVKQFPLRLAWAITVHKSQGMTLEEAEIDLSKTFEKGQGYVALSRLKSLEGLFLKGLNQTALQVDALALKADQRFRELSQEIDLQLTHQELQVVHNQFVEICGGTIKKTEIEKQEKKLKKKAKKEKLHKTNTYEQTKEMLLEKKPLEEIAKEKGIQLRTLYSHLDKIHKEDASFDFSFYRPLDEVFDKVKQAYEYLYKDSNKEFKLRPIFEHLNEQISYEDIKLCLLFIK